jgi:hypothetical protein
MWQIVNVLTPDSWSFEDVVRAWELAKCGGGRRRKRERAVGSFFIDHPLALGGYSAPEEIQKLYEESDADREGLGDLVALMNDMLEKAATISLQAKFGRLKWQIALGVVVGAAGIIAFAWAANPSDPEQPPASLRHADLGGADLTGVSLRNADLTGADVTDADFTGSDLSGATIDEVTWDNTTCPDGTNSDASAGAAGQPNANSTCLGHLVPQP